MQMICERAHENIKQWGKSFPKQLEMPGSIITRGPNFIKDQ